jgi:hypothetical protein
MFFCGEPNLNAFDLTFPDEICTQRRDCPQSRGFAPLVLQSALTTPVMKASSSGLTLEFSPTISLSKHPKVAGFWRLELLRFLCDLMSRIHDLCWDLTCMQKQFYGS